MRKLRTRLTFVAAAVCVVTLAGQAPASAASVVIRSATHPGPGHGWGHAKPTPGAAGAGDPYFPLSGNGGFDVSHYDLDVGYVPDTGKFVGHAVVTATATQDLSRFDLDLSGFTVASVLVDGHRATFSRSGQELIITPSRYLSRGCRFTVDVRYSGIPQEVTDPDGSPDGWIRTDTGAFVGSEPQGAMTWFPSNSQPIDKSSFDVTITVPKGYQAVGNGELLSQRTTSKTTTTHWRQRQPMAAYLATASIGKFQINTYRADGLPVYVAVDPREAAASAPVLAKLPAILAWEKKTFGPYPFSSTGAIVMHAPSVGYALETQTRPLFDRAPDTSTLVHELAHQWFGDSVSVTRWKDIWLNEGFATYAEWLYSEHTGGQTADKIFAELYASPAGADLWAFPVADPGAGEFIFADPPYNRGAMVLHELRKAVGDTTFFRILKTWASVHRYGHGTTAQFTALATAMSHKNLTGLFHTWLYTAGKPSQP
ncbi:aminopeptidase N [Nakamurella sp. UYEF19]|uniref:M1 family metallopeptidase n=1 Tax=Nakamurella sp. UYEF19 TaxID=1756392 RepID=UPI003394C03F